jgi:hypothetical protein
MRRKALLAAGLTTALTVMAGCHHDKHGLSYQPKEECVLPPDQPRYNNPPSAEYRKRPPKPEEKTLMGRDRMGAGPGPLGTGGF